MLWWTLIGVAIGAETPPELKASWRTTTAADFAHENDYEDVFESLSQVRSAIKWKLPGGDRLVLSVVGEHSARLGQDAEAEWIAWADDAYVDHRVGDLRLRIGNQVVRWGKLESTALLDVLNPTDLRHGVLSPIDDRRVPIPMIRARRGWGALDLDAVVIPFFVPARQSFIGSDWSLFPPGLLERTLQAAQSWEGDALTETFNQALVTGLSDALDQADDAFLRGVDRTLGEAGTPIALGRGAEAAIRMQWSGTGFDLGFQGGSVLEDVTTIIVDEALVANLASQTFPTTEALGTLIAGLGDAIEFAHPRFFFAGVDASSTLGVLTLRAEAAAFQDRALLTREMSLETSDELGAGVGIDWLTNPHIQASIEGSWRHLVDAEEESLLIRKIDEYAVSAQISGNLFRNQLKPNLAVQIDPVRAEAVLVTTLGWRCSDHVELTAGAFIFHSPSDTPDSIDSLLGYDGGAVGLFDHNDAATASFTYWF